VLVVALAGTLLGCGAAKPLSPDYTPRPDARLYAAIEKVPGVRSVRIRYVDTADRPQVYVGRIEVAPGTDLTSVLDHAMAILRQGRFRALLDLSVYSSSQTPVSSDTLVGDTRAGLDKRYGPQPGDGTPPPS
jgi:hypothetical protein